MRARANNTFLIIDRDCIFPATRMAASILLVVAVIGTQRQPDVLEAPVLRAPAEEPIKSLLPMDQPLSREQFVLRWRGPEGASYNIRVSTTALSRLASARGLEESEYQVPGGKLTDLPDGSRILWQVEAVLPGGEILRSRTFKSRLE